MHLISVKSITTKLTKFIVFLYCISNFITYESHFVIIQIVLYNTLKVNRIKRLRFSSNSYLSELHAYAFLLPGVDAGLLKIKKSLLTRRSVVDYYFTGRTTVSKCRIRKLTRFDSSKFWKRQNLVCVVNVSKVENQTCNEPSSVHWKVHKYNVRFSHVEYFIKISLKNMFISKLMLI